MPLSTRRPEPRRIIEVLGVVGDGCLETVPIRPETRRVVSARSESSESIELPIDVHFSDRRGTPSVTIDLEDLRNGGLV
ncbi:MAG: hypothetical protein ACRDZR_11720, partial [Acidimicrobiales bacterium]